ncbi:unknown [Firmicutes bacterium CAG:791]|nr:unknown [Firmicutes bacterium CAG:791]
MKLILLWLIVLAAVGLEYWFGIDWVDETRLGNAYRLMVSALVSAATVLTVMAAMY